MKKKLFFGLLAAAAVTFTACQKDEVLNQLPQDNEISFSTYLGRDAQVKGAIVEETQLKGLGLGFGVFAYYTGTTAASAYTFPATPNFLNNEKVYWDNTNSKWKYDNTKYWPNTTNEKISFYAYGPYEADASNAISVTTAAGNKPVLKYTVDNVITKHMDVLFAPAQEDKTKETTTVQFTFQHALSRIEFEVKTADDYTATSTIKLNSVKLSGKFFPSGSLSLGGSSIIWNTGEWNESTATIKEFTITETDDTRTVTTTPRIVKPTESGAADYIMIIPQTFAANGLNLAISYDQTIGGNTTTIPLTKTVNPSSTFKFVAGNAYKFIISIGMNEVTFSASVTPWAEVTPGTDVTF